MQIQNNNRTNFCAWVSPQTQEDANHLNKYLKQKTGRYEDRALGYFIIDQSKNHDVDLQFRHTPNGDYFAVYPYNNPQNITKVGLSAKYEPEWEKSINAEISEFMNSHPDVAKKGTIKEKALYKMLMAKKSFLAKKNATKWDILPDALKQAGEIANKMQKAFKK